MSLAPFRARQIERCSLHIGLFPSANLAVADVCVQVLSGSYALLLDGLKSAAFHPLLNALGQASGASAETEIVRSTRLSLDDLLAGLSC